MAVLPLKALLAILPFFLHVNAQASGTGTTTRYWDCCKPSCSWPGKTTLAAGSNPVGTCDSNDNLLSDYNTPSACNGGTAYMCSNESPWAVSNTLSYGYAAVNIAGGTEASWCCACYELTFTSGPVAGKKMVVQATNTGGDLGANQFDLVMPGGGFGIFNGCTQEYGTPSTGWGVQYGGISSRSQCDAFPAALKAGCYWRFDWFQDADNPAVSFQQVTCPAALTAKTGCVRADDSISEQPTGPAVVATWSSGSSGGATSAVGGTTTAVGSKTTSTSVESKTTSTSVGSKTTLTSVGAQTSSTAAAASSPVSAGTVPKWGQCGGIGWTGPTTCVSGTTCKVGNPWYSQCL